MARRSREFALDVVAPSLARIFAAGQSRLKHVIEPRAEFRNVGGVQARFLDPSFGGLAVPGARSVVENALRLTPFPFLDGPRSYSPVISGLRARPVGGMGLEWRMDYDPLRARLMNNALSVNARVGNFVGWVAHTQVS